MAEGPSSNAIVKRLVELSHMLDKATDEIDVLDDTAVQAKGRHRVAYARAFLTATGPMDVRTQMAIEQCEGEWFEWEAAEQKTRACRERIKTLRDQIAIAQSLGATMRSEWAASGYGT